MSTPKASDPVPPGPTPSQAAALSRPAQLRPPQGSWAHCGHHHIPALLTSDSYTTQFTPEGVEVICTIFIRLSRHLPSGTFSSPQKDTPSPFPTLPTSWPSVYFLSLWVCLCWTLDVSGNSQCVTFHVWIPPLRITVPRFIRVIRGVSAHSCLRLRAIPLHGWVCAGSLDAATFGLLCIVLLRPSVHGVCVGSFPSSWAPPKGQNCWWYGNSVLNRWRGTAGSVPLFPGCKFHFPEEEI